MATYAHGDPLIHQNSHNQSHMSCDALMYRTWRRPHSSLTLSQHHAPSSPNSPCADAHKQPVCRCVLVFVYVCCVREHACPLALAHTHTIMDSNVCRGSFLFYMNTDYFRINHPSPPDTRKQPVCKCMYVHAYVFCVWKSANTPAPLPRTHTRSFMHVTCVIDICDVT